MWQNVKCPNCLVRIAPNDIHVISVPNWVKPALKWIYAVILGICSQYAFHNNVCYHVRWQKKLCDKNSKYFTVLQTLQKLVRSSRLAKRQTKLQLPADLKQKTEQTLSYLEDTRSPMQLYTKEIWNFCPWLRSHQQRYREKMKKNVVSVTLSEGIWFAYNIQRYINLFFFPRSGASRLL